MQVLELYVAKKAIARNVNFLESIATVEYNTSVLLIVKTLALHFNDCGLRFCGFLGFYHELAAVAILGFRCCALSRLIAGLELLHIREYIVVLLHFTNYLFYSI